MLPDADKINLHLHHIQIEFFAMTENVDCLETEEAYHISGHSASLYSVRIFCNLTLQGFVSPISMILYTILLTPFLINEGENRRKVLLCSPFN